MLVVGTGHTKLLVVSIVKKGNKLAGKQREARNVKKAALESVLVSSRCDAKNHKFKIIG